MRLRPHRGFVERAPVRGLLAQHPAEAAPILDRLSNTAETVVTRQYAMLLQGYMAAVTDAGAALTLAQAAAALAPDSMLADHAAQLRDILRERLLRERLHGPG